MRNQIDDLKASRIILLIFFCGALLLSSIWNYSAPADEKEIEESTSNQMKKNEKLDYDFSLMNEIMATGQLQNILLKPKNYEGTVVRIYGQMRSSVNTDTNERHFGIYIMDPPRCCALLGIEFNCCEGKVYPDDYPEENSMITATGIITLIEGGRRLSACLSDTVITWE